MKTCSLVCLLVMVAVNCVWGQSAAVKLAGPRSPVLLEKLSWDEAEAVLTPAAVVVIPLGRKRKSMGAICS